MSIWRVLLWQILDPIVYVVLDRLAALLSLPAIQIRFDFTAITIVLSQAILVATLLLLGFTERTVRDGRFWLLCIPLLVFVLVAALSQYWSVTPSSTSKRSWYLWAVTFGGVFIGLTFTRPKILRMYEIFVVLLVVGSYVLIAKYPNPAIDTEYDIAGAWRGMLKYKGYAGTIMAFAASVFLLRLSQWKQLTWGVRVYAAVFLGLSLLFVYQSKSATGQLAAIAVIGTFLLGLCWLRWGHVLRARHWRLLALIGACLVPTLLAVTPVLIRLFGRDASLTGRIPLWRALAPFIQARLALGWGFGDAFWLSKEVERLWQVITWKPGTAHSGFVEVVLDTGMVGLGALIAFLATTTALTLRYIRVHRSAGSLVFLVWLVLVALVNIGENLLATYELFFWLALVITFAHTAREAISGEGPGPGLSTPDG